MPAPLPTGFILLMKTPRDITGRKSIRQWARLETLNHQSEDKEQETKEQKPEGFDREQS
jgi:hypothetical protein